MNNTLVISADEYGELIRTKTVLEMVTKTANSELYNADEFIKLLVNEGEKEDEEENEKSL